MFNLLRLLRHLEPGYKIPSRTHLTTLIKKQWKDGQEALGAVLKTPDFISLTTDIWTSRSTQAFETTTAHFLSSDWELKRVLETRLFSGSHTGVRIAEKIKASLKQYGIAAETVTAVVHDEAANACLARHILVESDNWESIVCLRSSFAKCNQGRCAEACLAESACKMPTFGRTLQALRVGHARNGREAKDAENENNPASDPRRTNALE